MNVKLQTSSRAWAFVLMLVLLLTTTFGGFSFLGIDGSLGEAYAQELSGTINCITPNAIYKINENCTMEALEISSDTTLEITSGAIVTVTSEIAIKGSVIITGGGMLKAGDGFQWGALNAIIKVTSGATLTMSGITIDGNNKARGIYNSGTFDMSGGASITSCSAFFGGGVHNTNSGTFNMRGGEITSCSAQNGGGVYNYKGTLTMNGNASITSCKAKYGGGIYNIGAQFYMNGSANITSCSATGTGTTYGGGVYNYNSTLTMNDNASIMSCSATSGGGVYNYGTAFTMNGNASITSCSATNGGGVYNYGETGKIATFNMNGSASITSCSAESFGGGVYNTNNGTFTMSGGTITSCSATNGGGVYNTNNGTFTMSGGTITSCSATNGGGVYNSATIVLYGAAKIQDNIKTDYGLNNNVYLDGDKHITLGGSGLTTGAVIGVVATGTVNNQKIAVTGGAFSGSLIEQAQFITMDAITPVYEFFVNRSALYYGKLLTPASIEGPTAIMTVTYGGLSESISVTAITEADVAISQYQWYKSMDETTSGGVAVQGATSASFSIPTTLTPGAYHYFYCVVTVHLTYQNIPIAYTTSNAVTKVTVSKGVLTPSLTGGLTKSYDGTTSSAATITLSGINPSDIVTAAATSIEYDTAGVGNDKTITAYNITLGGVNAGYYCLSTTTAITTGSIEAIAPGAPTSSHHRGNTTAPTYNIEVVTMTTGITEETPAIGGEAPKTDNGTVNVTGSNKPGDTVLVTITPDVSFFVASVRVRGDKGSILPVSKNADGTYSYVAPAENTIVYITYEPIFKDEKETPSFILCLKSWQNMNLNGNPISLDTYNVDGYNYVKLRDLALVLNASGSKFGVEMGEGMNIILTPGQAYVPVGGELVYGTDMTATCVVSPWTVTIKGIVRYLDVYNIGGNNYFKIRDLGALLNFGVDYDEMTDTALLTAPCVPFGTRSFQ